MIRMKRYKTIFYSFHTLYRLSTTSGTMKDFSLGICRIFKNAFKADRVVLICRNLDTNGFMKIKIKNNKQIIKKGGLSILTRREKIILNQEKGIDFPHRLIFPFSFIDTLGVIYLRRESKHADFNDVDKKWFIALSEETAMSLKIFNLYREERKMLLNYIKVLTKYLESYTPVHSKSIRRLARAVGKKMKLSELEIRSLEYASLLHDAGEIQMPHKILKEERKLTVEEYKVIMRHPRKGVELIKDVDILRPVIPIVLHHHERYDGKGYPYRLKKDQIPLGSRILTVIDSFDAMFFGRPYKKKMSLIEVEEEIARQSGRQFDPKIVDVFLNVLKQKGMRKYLQSFQ